MLERQCHEARGPSTTGHDCHHHPPPPPPDNCEKSLQQDEDSRSRRAHHQARGARFVISFTLTLSLLVGLLVASVASAQDPSPLDAKEAARLKLAAEDGQLPPGQPSAAGKPSTAAPAATSSAPAPLTQPTPKQQQAQEPTTVSRAPTSTRQTRATTRRRLTTAPAPSGSTASSTTATPMSALGGNASLEADATPPTTTTTTTTTNRSADPNDAELDAEQLADIERARKRRLKHRRRKQQQQQLMLQQEQGASSPAAGPSGSSSSSTTSTTTSTTELPATAARPRKQPTSGAAGAGAHNKSRHASHRTPTDDYYAVPEDTDYEDYEDELAATRPTTTTSASTSTSASTTARAPSSTTSTSTPGTLTSPRRPPRNRHGQANGTHHGPGSHHLMGPHSPQGNETAAEGAPPMEPPLDGRSPSALGKRLTDMITEQKGKLRPTSGQKASSTTTTTTAGPPPAGHVVGGGMFVQVVNQSEPLRVAGGNTGSGGAGWAQLSPSNGNATDHALDWSKLVKVMFKSARDNRTIYTLVMNSSELSQHPISDWSNELPALLQRDFEKLSQKWSNVFPSVMDHLMANLTRIMATKMPFDVTLPAAVGSLRNITNLGTLTLAANGTAAAAAGGALQITPPTWPLPTNASAQSLPTIAAVGTAANSTGNLTTADAKGNNATTTVVNRLDGVKLANGTLAGATGNETAPSGAGAAANTSATDELLRAGVAVAAPAGPQQQQSAKNVTSLTPATALGAQQLPAGNNNSTAAATSWSNQPGNQTAINNISAQGSAQGITGVGSLQNNSNSTPQRPLLPITNDSTASTLGRRQFPSTRPSDSNKTIHEIIRDIRDENIKIEDNVKEQGSSLRHFIIICSISVVVATSIVVALIVLLFK